MKKIVLITGSAGRIGSATAKLFSEKGWFVMGIDKKLDSSNEYIDDYLQADLSDPSVILSTINEINKKRSHLDALINNAALQICKPVLEMGWEEWDKVMAVNVRASFLLAQGFYPLLRQCQGSIVNISSVHALVTSDNIAAYAASKGAITAFTRALAIEWARDKIRVNSVLPGAVNTTMLEEGLSRGHLEGQTVNEKINQLGRRTVMGRVGEPEEIAQAIFFFADSQMSSFITGQQLVIDGGATIKLSTE